MQQEKQVGFYGEMPHKVMFIPMTLRLKVYFWSRFHKHISDWSVVVLRDKSEANSKQLHKRASLSLKS